MPAKTPQERSLYASIASLERWAREVDRSKATEKARKAADDRFLAEVDPDGKLDPVQRAKMAEAARKAFYQRLTLARLQKRRQRAEGGA